MKRDPEKLRAWQQRSKGLNRSGLKRSRRKTARDPEARLLFTETARKQIVCARCGLGGPWEAHHVVEKQWLRDNGFPIDDPDNALRLCPFCHARHTTPATREDRLHLNNLMPQNLRFAFRTMGEAAGIYLRRRYRGEDPRLDTLEQAHEQ